MNVRVPLTVPELYTATTCGLQRAMQSVSLGLTEKIKNHTFLESVSLHILGATSELAVAKFLNIFPPMSYNTFKDQPDLVSGLVSIEVRHRRNPSWDLIIRDDDNKKALFILTTGEPPVIEVVGGILGEAGMKEEYKANHGGMAPAFFVPQSKLRKPSELKSFIRFLNSAMEVTLEHKV